MPGGFSYSHKKSGYITAFFIVGLFVHLLNFNRFLWHTLPLIPTILNSRMR